MTDTLDHNDTRETLWVTDAELIRRSGIPERIMRRNLRYFDANPSKGFPRKNALWGDRRYWPEVKAFWDKMASSQPPQRTKP